MDIVQDEKRREDQVKFFGVTAWRIPSGAAFACRKFGLGITCVENF
jgi:hypothetical protein